MRLLVPLPFDITDLAHGRNLRVVNLLKGLRNHVEVTILAPDAARGQSARTQLVGTRVHVAACAPAHRTKARKITRVDRCISYYDVAPQLAASIPGIVGEHDVVLGFDLSSAAALLAAKTHAPEVPVICDLIDDPWLTWRSLPLRDRVSPAGLKTAVSLRHVRRMLLARMDGIVTAGQPDAISLRSASAHRIEVVPNGVEIEPACSVQAAREPLAVMTGYMSFPPNERAALLLLHHIWPRVRRELRARGLDDARLAIVGAEPTARVERAARVAGALVTGRVPSVREWLLRARLAIAPMRSGSGIKNKILEACACGCPVVTTPLGAAGLPIGETQGILTGNSAAALTHSCIELMLSPGRAATIGTAGYRTVQSAFTWPTVAARLFDIIRQQVHQRDTVNIEVAADLRHGEAGAPLPAAPVLAAQAVHTATARCFEEEALADATS